MALCSTRVLYVRNLLRATNIAFCVMAVISGYTLVVVVYIDEAEYLLLATHQSSEWLYPSCVQSKLSIASLSLLSIYTSPMLLQPKIVEGSSTPSDAEFPGMRSTFRIE